MPDITEVFVDYVVYCKTCKFKDLEGWKDPCNECIGTPVRKNTTKPVNYVKEETKNAQ